MTYMHEDAASATRILRQHEKRVWEMTPTPLSQEPYRLGTHRRGGLLLAQLQQLALAEGQLAAMRIYHDRVAGLELALEDIAREPGLNHALDRPPQRASAVGRHIALMHQQLLGARRQLQRHALLMQPLGHLGHQQV